MRGTIIFLFFIIISIKKYTTIMVYFTYIKPAKISNLFNYSKKIWRISLFYILSGTSMPSSEKDDLITQPTIKEICTLMSLSFSLSAPNMGTLW